MGGGGVVVVVIIITTDCDITRPGGITWPRDFWFCFPGGGGERIKCNLTDF